MLSRTLICGHFAVSRIAQVGLNVKHSSRLRQCWSHLRGLLLQHVAFTVVQQRDLGHQLLAVSLKSNAPIHGLSVSLLGILQCAQLPTELTCGCQCQPTDLMNRSEDCTWLCLRRLLSGLCDSKSVSCSAVQSQRV